MSKWLAWCFVLTLALAAVVPAAVQLQGQSAGLDWSFISHTDEQSKWPEPRVCTLGARLSTPRCIEVDEYGRIYLLDHARQALMRFSSTGQLEQSWPDGIDYGFQPEGRRDISLAPGKGVFMPPISDLILGVRRIDPDTGTWVTFPVSGLYRTYSIAAAPSGGFYLYDDKPPGAGEIHAFGADGRQLTSWTTQRVSSLAMGPDGLIYCGLWEKHGIDVYSPKGKLKREIDLSGLLTDRFMPVESLRVDLNGDMYFIYRYSWIVRLDRAGRFLARWHACPSPGSTAINRMFQDLAVRNGLIYALCDGQVQVFTPRGQCVVRYEAPKLPLDMPGALAVHPDGSYAVEQHGGPGNALVFDSNDKLVGKIVVGARLTSIIPDANGGYYTARGYSLDRFGANGEKIATVAGRVPGGTIDDYVDASQIARDPVTGDVWSIGMARMAVYGPDDKLIKRLPARKELVGGDFVGGMAVDPRGFLYVSDGGHNRILVYDLDGSLVAAYGKQGSGLGELEHPMGLALDDKGRLYVADTGNSRVQVFSAAGESLGFWGHRGTGDGELDRPLAVALGPNSMLWISDTFNDRIVRVPLDVFWKQITKAVPPEPVVQVARKQATPAQGAVTVNAIVIAGSDDFTDEVFLESPDRAWGISAVLPKGMQLRRGERVRAVGVMDVASRRLTVQSVEQLAAAGVPTPLGMANLYVGDGYRAADAQSDLSNLCLLVKTWGRVTSVDAERQYFTINDGSYSDNDGGLAVCARDMVTPLSNWPKVGQFVGVVGVSTTLAASDALSIPCVRVRGDADIDVFGE